MTPEDTSELIRFMMSKELRNRSMAAPHLAELYLELFKTSDPEEVGSRFAALVGAIALDVGLELPTDSADFLPLLRRECAKATPNWTVFGNMLSYQILGNHFDLQLGEVASAFPKALRGIGGVWILAYVSWLYLIQTRGRYGEEFAAAMAKASELKLRDAEKLQPSLGNMSGSMNYWFDQLDKAVEFLGVKIDDLELPFELLAAWTFLISDPASPYYKDSQIEGTLDTQVAEVLIAAKAETQAWIVQWI